MLYEDSNQRWNTSGLSCVPEASSDNNPNKLDFAIVYYREGEIVYFCLHCNEDYMLTVLYQDGQGEDKKTQRW